MIAPPGYPNRTSTPASWSVRHRIALPVKTSRMAGLHSPEVAAAECHGLEPIGVVHLVQRMHQRAGTGFDDVGGSAVTRERLAVDAHLQDDAAKTVAPGRHRLHRELEHLDRPADR